MLSWDMKPQPVIESANNATVFTPEHLQRQQDVTNSVYDGYEYSQPKSYRLVANTNFQANNPFNTPAQMALLYIRVNDAAAYLVINFDTNDTSTLTLATNIVDFPGFLVTQTGNTPITPLEHWIDFQNVITIRAQGITTFTEFCLLFRRKRDMYIPRNLTAFNGPEQ